MTKVLQSAGFDRHPKWKDQGRGFQLRFAETSYCAFASLGTSYATSVAGAQSTTTATRSFRVSCYELYFGDHQSDSDCVHDSDWE